MKIIKYIFSISILLSCPSIYTFENLTEIKNYANTRPEFPKADNKDWNNPDYTTFYESIRPSFWNKLLISLKLGQFYVSKEKFFKKLQELSNKRKSELKYEDYVISLNLKEDSKLVIWGEINAAFHSLVRDLLDLQSQGIIDENLKIIKPDYYFVFIGNLVNGNPYNLLTLELATSLMEKNPNKVFYLKGNQEYKKNWENFCMSSEIQIFYESIEKRNSLINLINSFFDTLPLGLFLSVSNNTKDSILISYFGRDTKKFDVNNLNESYVPENNKDIKFYNIAQNNQISNPANILGMIRGQKRTPLLDTPRTLNLLEPEFGSTAWVLLSSPTTIYKDIFKFFKDAYAILTIKNPIEKSVITLRTQDLKNHSGFIWQESYNVATGELLDSTDRQESADAPAVAQGYGGHSKAMADRKERIVIGSSLALTGGLADSALKIQQGIFLATKKVNMEGGIKGRNIKLVILDDKYNPKFARNNIEKMMQMGIDTFICNTGTSTLKPNLDLIKDGKILVLFPPTGSQILREPDLKGIVNFRASYKDEVNVVVNYVLKILSPQSWGAFYTYSTAGNEELEQAQKILSKYNIELSKFPYELNRTDFKKILNTFKDSLIDALGLFADSLPTEELIRQIGVEKFFGMKLFALSPLGSNSFKRFMKQRGISTIFCQVTPNPMTSKLEIIKEYYKESTEVGLNPDPYALEGYIGMSILIDTIRQIDGKVTKEKILEKITSFKDYDFKGLKLTFDKKRRDLGQNSVWLDIGQSEWLEMKPQAEA
ncbi:ABC transporter substrate-binding protein [Candidatus Dependentiae bacterium]|nr:ABC transporter substrate-binding protein [Candidatus Dependentiae bacterium]